MGLALATVKLRQKYMRRILAIVKYALQGRLQSRVGAWL